MAARGLAALGIGVGVAVLVGARLLGPPTAPRPEARTVAAPPPAGPETASTVADAPRGGLPPPPASLAGTEPDGALTYDAQGRLLVTRDVLDFFEYFLSASGEEPLAVTRARIEAEIEARLPASAREAARDLLERTLAYRDAIRALREEGLDEANLERRFLRIREVRREWFTAVEREAFFGEEEARWAVDIERRRVALDPELSRDERRERLAALDDRLPVDARETRARALAPTRLLRDEAALREAGASDAEIQALRTRRFGPEAAERLRALDARRAAFEARVAQWRSEAERLRERGASEDEIAAARARSFEGPELLRVEALDRIEAATAR